MKAIAILYQGRKPQTTEVARQLVPFLEKQGYKVLNIDIQKEDEEEASINHPLRGCELVLVLGGDGTILQAARLCAEESIPIVGVNFGRVGFLTEIEPDNLFSSLTHYLNKDDSVWIDTRTMLQATLNQDDQSEEVLALNDIVIARGTWPRVVQVGVWIDDHFYNTTYADGLIISTATGSTAYNLAVGGPLLHPQVQSSVLTPIAPHLASDRSLVLQPDACVRLQITTGSQDCVFSADGQINREIRNGATITVNKSKFVTKFLRRRAPTNFYQIINAKLRDDD